MPITQPTKLHSPLETRLSNSLEKRRARSKLRVLSTASLDDIDFSSNDFLSLATTKRFRDDYLEELQRVTLPVGSTGSRLLDGNSAYAEELEERIASFHGAEAGLLVNSGFDANVSIFGFLPQPGDAVVYDELIHASVHDGMRQSRAKSFVSFKHNCTSDLRKKLQPFSTSPQAQVRNVFVAVESVYSMDGDLAPLKEITEVIDQMFPDRNCHLIVDEAHSTGVYGPLGKGRVCELGLEQSSFIRLHTFGKALACNGAIILCPPIVRSYLINYARPLIYTTFMSYSSLSAVKVAYDWLQRGETEQLAGKLFALIQHLHTEMQSLQPLISATMAMTTTSTSSVGITPEGEPAGHRESEAPTLQISTDCPQSPIFALLTTNPRQLATFCQQAGFVVRPVVAPTVPKGTERVRVCLHAGNTKSQIDQFVAHVRKWLHLVGRSRLDPDNNTGDVSDHKNTKTLVGSDVSHDPSARLATAAELVYTSASPSRNDVDLAMRHYDVRTPSNTVFELRRSSAFRAKL